MQIAYAIKINIGSITEGKFVDEANHVISSDGRRLQRVWITGTILSKYASNDKNFSSITIDDGTANIRVKAFDSNFFDKYQEADKVEVVGKIKKYNDEVYINPDSAWKMNSDAAALREREITASAEAWKKKVDSVMEYQKAAATDEELRSACTEAGIDESELQAIMEAHEIIESAMQKKKDQILQTIEKLDSGDGCDYAVLIENANMPESELDEIVDRLLDEGSCFEPRAGKIKKI